MGHKAAINNFDSLVLVFSYYSTEPKQTQSHNIGPSLSILHPLFYARLSLVFGLWCFPLESNFRDAVCVRLAGVT